MKKVEKLKLILLFITLILTTGCNNKELNKFYENMQVSKTNIVGYKLDLRIHGDIDGKRINEIVRITNYNNNQYEIIKVRMPGSGSVIESSNEEISYIKNGKLYVSDNKDGYKESKEESKYKKPDIYLKGLVNISSIEEPTTEKIGENKYTKYTVEYKKNIVKEILKDTVIEEMDIKNDVKGEVLIDKDGYVYRIMYEIDNVTINATYYGINSVYPISITTP